MSRSESSAGGNVTTAYDVLLAGDGCGEVAGAIHHEDQDVDQGESVVWLSDDAVSTRLQQEHGAAYYSGKRQPGSLEPGGLPAMHPWVCLPWRSVQTKVGL